MDTAAPLQTQPGPAAVHAPAASASQTLAGAGSGCDWSDSPRQLRQTSRIAQLHAPATATPATAPAAAQGGLPGGLRQGVESLSGMDMSDVRVHRNSSKPAQLQALAYAQGSDIHLGPGQDKHLPHEAWHVVQQKQGRVRATRQMRAGVGVNDDSALEREADVMGARALQCKLEPSTEARAPVERPLGSGQPVQRLMGIEGELSVPVSVDAPAADGTARVTNFLAGGVQEGTAIEPMNGQGYMKEADHDDVSRESANVLTQANANFGLGIPVPAFRVANLEYKTRPFNEEVAAERVAFQACITHMAHNMIAVTAAARNGLTANAAGTHNVGLPAIVDWQHFSATHVGTGMAAGWGTSARNAINGYISTQPDVQITMGIRLEKVREHLTGAHGHATLRPAAAQNPNGFLTLDPVNTANAVINHTPGLTAAQRGSAALKGYFTLVIQYLHGNFAYRGPAATVGKNMVGFLSKYPLHRVQRELDVAIRPDQWAPAQRTALYQSIVASVNTRRNQPDVAPLWQGIMGGDGGGPLGNWRQWLRRAMRGHSDAFSAAQIGPPRYLAPSDHVNSTVINAGPNARPAGAGGAHHSGVIPMEARHIGRVPPAALWGTVNNVITHVRNTNA